MRRLLARLGRPDAAEIRFRCAEAARIAAEAVRFTSGRERWHSERLGAYLRPAPELEAALHSLAAHDWKRAQSELRAHFLRRPSRFLIHPAQRGTIAAAIRAAFPSSADDAVQRAERILEGRHDFLAYSDLSFARPDGAIDWHLDPVHRRRAPAAFWRRVPYLDPRVGDHKVIWELNRHQHWLALGRAAWLTGNARYAAAATQELRSWMTANPPLAGINWSSMLELAFRSISWVWALHFLAAFDDEADSTWIVDLLAGLDRQLDHVVRHLSVYFSPNTHLLGEGLALYVAGRALPELRHAARWEEIGRRVLLREATAQINLDGGHAELSTHYHRYALDFYLFALAIARKTGDAAAGESVAEVAARLASFCRAIAGDDGRLPTIGDDDGGLLFPICGRAPADASDSLSFAASLLGRPELAVGDPSEEVLWLLGGDRAALARRAAPHVPGSRAFPDSGYVVLRSTGAHAVLDAGPHGFLNGGHAHADALSIVLSVHGHPLLIDPGTATYTMDPELRDRFRSTAMHNTVVVNGRSQAEPAGPFHWRSRADARIELWRAGRAFDHVEAAHDAYAPLVHRRAVVRLAEDLWIVADHLIGGGSGSMQTHWHLDPAWRPDGTPAEGSRTVAHPAALWAAIASTAHDMREFLGDAEGLGWCAPVYGRVVPSLTLRFTRSGESPLSIVTAIAACPEPLRLSIESVPVAADADDGWHRVAVSVQRQGLGVLASFATPAREAAPVRSVHRVRCPATRLGTGGELATDARMALLRLSRAGEPQSLSLVDGRLAIWTGPAPFAIDLPAPAADLHFDPRAQRGLSHSLDACGGRL